VYPIAYRAYTFKPPFKTVCLPLSYSGNPGVNEESDRGANGSPLFESEEEHGGSSSEAAAECTGVSKSPVFGTDTESESEDPRPPPGTHGARLPQQGGEDDADGREIPLVSRRFPWVPLQNCL
jgi:hypothetical protein